MIPTNILLLIGTKLPKEDVYTYCQLNKTTRNICQSEFFWQKILGEQYGDFFIVTKPNNKNLVEWYRYLMYANIFYKDPKVILDLAENNGFVELKNYIQSSLPLDSLILEKKYKELKKITTNRHILFISSRVWDDLIYDNNYNIILWLLEHGANIHVDSDYALRAASAYGHIEIVKLLLEYKADIHADNDEALRWASENGHTEIVQLLLENDANLHADNDNTLRRACEYGHTEIVKLLLQYKANPHANNDEPLKLAQKNEHPDIVKLLEAAMHQAK